MAELDNLLGSRISLISQVDVRYDGILFSINAKESSIVLKDVRCLGTEERVADASKKIPASHGVLAFVAFPGSDIKDLYLHDYDSSTPEPPAPEPQQQQQKKAAPAQPAKQPQQQPRAAPVAASAPPSNPGKSARPQSQGQAKAPPAKPAQQDVSGPPAKAAAAPAPRGDKGSSGIGTGEHLLHLRVKKSGDQNQAGAANATAGVFDFAAALSAFNKTEVMETVAQDPERVVPTKAMYKKDDFFDSLSCDVLDREMGRRTHMTNSEERHLNQDTFGAVALQSNYSSRGGRRYNNTGGGRGGNYGRGQGQQQGRGRGGGRGGGNRGGGRGGGGGYRGGRGGSQQHNAASA